MFKLDSKSVNNLLGERTIIHIPFIQRNYEWKQELFIGFLKDVLEAHSKGELIWISNLILQESAKDANGVGGVKVLDGQQRLTSILIIFGALKNFCNKNYDERGWLISEIDAKITLPLQGKKERRYKIRRGNDSEAIFYQILDGSKIKGGSASPMVSNYRWACDFLTEENYYNVFESLTSAMFSTTTYDSGANAAKIFNTCNSLRQDIAISHKIKNLFLAIFDDERQEFLYENYWSKLEQMLDMSMSNGYNRKWNALDDFLLNFMVSYENNPTCTKETLLRDYAAVSDKSYEKTKVYFESMLQYAMQYMYIQGMAEHPNIAINAVLKDVSNSKFRVGLPFYIRLLVDVEDKKLDINDFLDVSQVIMSFYIRSLVFNLSSKGQSNAYRALYIQSCKQGGFNINAVKSEIKTWAYFKEIMDDKGIGELLEQFIQNDSRKWLLKFLENKIGITADTSFVTKSMIANFKSAFINLK